MSLLLAEPPVAIVPSPTKAEKPLNKESIAELSLCEIEAMPRAQLVAAIRAVVVPFVDNDRLEFQDRQTLLRLLYLARRCCRNQGY